MKKTTTRQNIKSKDTKKNKGLNEKEKSKKEEKIDPNDLVMKLAVKHKIYSVPLPTEPCHGCLPVDGTRLKKI